MFLFYESKMLTVALTTDSSEKASAPTLTDVSTEITKLLNPNRREITIVYKITNVIENKTLVISSKRSHFLIILKLDCIHKQKGKLPRGVFWILRNICNGAFL